MRHLRPRHVDVSPQRLALAIVLCATASELKFRSRSGTAAVEGAIDAQIIVELAVWGLVGLALLVHLLRRGRSFTSLLPVNVGPALRAASALAALIVFGSLVAFQPLSIVRAGQFVFLTLLIVATFHRVQGEPELLVPFWQTLRRGLWAVLLLSAVGTLVTSGAGLVEFEGQDRYAFFAMHANATGNLLGLGIVMAVSSAFGLEEPLTRTRVGKLAGGMFLGALTVLLLLTKARGAIGAAAIGVIVVIALSRRGQRKLAAVLMVLAGLAVVLAGFGDDSLFAALTRGESSESLRTLTGRTELWDIAFDLFLQRPVFGYGFLAARSVVLDIVPWAGNAHNLLAEIAISFGVIGIIAYGVLGGRLVRVIWVTLRRPVSLAAIALCETAGLLAFVVVAGVVGAGPATVPGFEFSAILAAALFADLVRVRRRSALAAGPAAPDRRLNAPARAGRPAAVRRSSARR